MLKHRMPGLFRPAAIFLRDFNFLETRPKFVQVENNRVHLNQVYNAGETVRRPYRELQNKGIGNEFFPNAINAHFKVGANLVHLVDKAKTGDAVFLSLSPHSLALRLHPFAAVENHQGPVKHSQRPFDLGRKINMPRRINQINFGALPRESCRRRSNGNPSFLLLLQIVHHRRAFVHLAHFVGLAGIIKNPLRHRRLPGVNMSDNPDIAQLFKFVPHHLKYTTAANTNKYKKNCHGFCRKAPWQFETLLLPREMSKRLVGVRHLVHVLPHHHCAAFFVVGLKQFRRKPLAHWFALGAPGSVEYPSYRKRLLTP